MDIKIKGSVKVSVRDGYISTDKKARLTKNGSEWVITGRDNATNYWFGNGCAISGGNSVISYGSDSVCVSGNDIWINGKKIDKKSLKECTSEPNDPDYKIISEILPNSIRSVSIVGAGDIVMYSDIDHKGLSLKISGSGDISVTPLIPITIDAFNVQISGSGDINTNSKIKTVMANVQISGSGDVSGFHIINSGMVSVSGSGDVKLTANNPSKIMKNKCGSGSIKIYQT